MYGRRRVGKSWLLRRFAHGKPAVILSSERLALTRDREAQGRTPRDLKAPDVRERDFRRGAR
jgi:predicted GTPase